MSVVTRPSPDLDSALRPYISTLGSPRNAYFSGTPVAPATEPATEPEDAPVLEITARGRVETVTLESVGVTVNWSNESEADNVQTETTRSTSTVRVENPDDPEQYVDVEITNAMTLKTAKGVLKQWIFTNG